MKRHGTNPETPRYRSSRARPIPTGFPFKKGSVGYPFLLLPALH
jgi:hypothetical protein